MNNQTEPASIERAREEIAHIDRMLSNAGMADDYPTDAIDAVLYRAADTPPTEAVRDVLAERKRQVEIEGWSPDHDDKHDGKEMARAAAAYAIFEDKHVIRPPCWPWEAKWWKPRGRRSNLVKAGALILAEIERIDRACK